MSSSSGYRGRREASRGGSGSRAASVSRGGRSQDRCSDPGNELTSRAVDTGSSQFDIMASVSGFDASIREPAEASQPSPRDSFLERFVQHSESQVNSSMDPKASQQHPFSRHTSRLQSHRRKEFTVLGRLSVNSIRRANFLLSPGYSHSLLVAQEYLWRSISRCSSRFSPRIKQYSICRLKLPF